VLIIYAVEEEAKEIDKALCKTKSPRYKYISYHNSSSQEKLAAMYHNEIKNEKAKYETLFNIQLRDTVMVKDNRSYISLENVLMDAKINE